MISRALPALFTLGQSLGLKEPAVRRPPAVLIRTFLVLALTLLIFAIDVAWDRTNISVFYVVPLLLLVQGGKVRYEWRITGLMVLLTFAAFQIKKMISPEGPTTPYLHYSLLNRTLTATMLLVVAWGMRLWTQWGQREGDDELPVEIRYQDREISATLALCICVPLVVVLVAIDIFSPANYNLAILYLIPLFVCVWTNSRRLLWTMLTTLVLLAIAAQMLGPGPTDPRPVAEAALLRNRVLTIVGMMAVSAILSSWIAGDEPSDIE